ncbi:MAG: DUF1761 domain-containing protein [Pseudomonadota bacterium]
MSIISVLAAALGSFIFGAIWYSVFAKRWMAVSGVEVVDGKPANQSDPVPYIMALVAAVLVAGMMRHVFVMSETESIAKGALNGLGLGLFMAAPWMATCYCFEGRPRALILINGGYAAIGSTIMGAILTAF